MSQTAGEIFDAQRSTLLRVAYRMLGTIADAEDVVQDAYVRWQAVDHAEVAVPAAFLRRIVTRLCLDHLKSARVQREIYVGPWLPEPAVDDALDDDVTLPLLLALERLSPLERAAFLLHDVFGERFEDIALVLDRDVPACRQLASRARGHVRDARPRFPIDHQHGKAIAAAFFEASQKGDMAQLSMLLAQDVQFHADGGGKRPAVARILQGASEYLRAQAALIRLRRAPSELVRFTTINGLPGFITREPDGLLQTTALLVEGRHIQAIYVIRNPDKLTRVH
ncbi:MULTISPECIES: RNA polymerase sigma factor SigJ [Novosphingobium]|uniref:RNA polymerase sigma factor SigJ n=1 Tax=Novosphingobium TaxID=165696 RepID=UPI0009FD8FEA|nr:MULTISPECIES: RNA polymerase sigma factor SigJ [Novosphingobium]MBB3357265.1 RNA polymerase sigma-70 factor (ECF subfamily) [Novosphingobium sp. BK256]MBB3374073.1 RNA polymerase sigma-70 factor (ECF subfamily) [Novosphingobium sp. BK280]MBB3378485.1 RNA polymerase sigma-70 factor (ECF subfamily) [Novosphingobium sp. BK258]MBB3419731.1 RNA polymerase sigma-70 factor (ECF subfamily) [Novosphingobium sp. BK267]MBB3447948.1 RNA polymerase sigma-70 factor (ECF subfamily) [Novosphingobium sp. BK